MIDIRCHQCGRRCAAPEQQAGKSIKCPACGSRIVVPRTSDDSATPPSPHRNGGATTTDGLVVECSCGKRFRAKTEWSGKTGKCPGCGKALMIPNAKGSAPDLTAPPQESSLEALSTPLSTEEGGTDAAKETAPAQPARLRHHKNAMACKWCKSSFSIPIERRPGEQIRCPRCGHEHTVPRLRADPNRETGSPQICPSCGKELARKAVLCTSCGHRLVEVAPKTGKGSPGGVADSGKSPSVGTPTWAKPAAGCCALVAGLFAVIEVSPMIGISYRYNMFVFAVTAFVFFHMFTSFFSSLAGKEE